MQHRSKCPKLGAWLWRVWLQRCGLTSSYSFLDWYQSKMFPLLSERQRCRRCIHAMVLCGRFQHPLQAQFPNSRKEVKFWGYKAVGKQFPNINLCVLPKTLAEPTVLTSRRQLPASVLRIGAWKMRPLLMQWRRVAEMLTFLGVNDKGRFPCRGLSSCWRRSSPNAYSSSLVYALESVPWIIPWKSPVSASTVRAG